MQHPLAVPTTATLLPKDKRGKGVLEFAELALRWPETPLYSRTTKKRGGGGEMDLFCLGMNRHSIPYKIDFPPILVLCCYAVGFHGVTADSWWRKGRI